MKIKIMKTIFSGVTSGIFIGLCISMLFSYLSKSNYYHPAPQAFSNQFDNEITEMIVSVLIWSAIGIVFSLSSLIFWVTDWSVTKMTVTHFCVDYIGFLPLAIYAKWFPLNSREIIVFSIIYLLIYIIMWFIFMFLAKKEVASLNDKIHSS